MVFGCDICVCLLLDRADRRNGKLFGMSNGSDESESGSWVDEGTFCVGDRLRCVGMEECYCVEELRSS